MSGLFFNHSLGESYFMETSFYKLSIKTKVDFYVPAKNQVFKHKKIQTCAKAVLFIFPTYTLLC